MACQVYYVYICTEKGKDKNFVANLDPDIYKA